MKNSVIFAAILLLVLSSCNDQAKEQKASADDTTKVTKEKSTEISASANEDHMLDDSTGFTAIYNHRNLDGWKMQGKGFWQVEQGEIVGRQDPSEKDDSWLFSSAEWSDFVLALEFYITKNCNSGIGIRMPKDSTGAPDVFGYEVQISDLPQRKLTGSLLHHVESGGNNLHHPDQWNQMLIICKDDHIRVYLNQQKILDEKVNGSKKGRIGLQVPNGAAFSKQVVRFRNLRVKDLNAVK